MALFHAAINFLLTLLFLWKTVLRGEAFATTPDDRSIVMSADHNNINNDNNEIPRLPPPGEDSGKLPVIKLGETISFEAMGPIILNADGTTRRIANWDNMTEQEQKVTWRRISQRNEQRRQQLLLQQQQAQQQQQPADSSDKTDDL